MKHAIEYELITYRNLKIKKKLTFKDKFWHSSEVKKFIRIALVPSQRPTSIKNLRMLV